jgi:hypothetical protein
MRTITKVSLGVLLVPFIQVSVAIAQQGAVQQGAITVPATTFSSCEQSPPAADAYMHCALRFEHDRLKQGALGTELAHAKPFKPVALSRYVKGDSALVYASRYERLSRRGDVITLLGGVAILNSMVLARQHCGDVFCSHSDLKLRSRLFLGAGGAITFVGITNVVRSVKARNRALWWSNSSLPGASK